jgi:hypothetical protein
MLQAGRSPVLVQEEVDFWRENVFKIDDGCGEAIAPKWATVFVEIISNLYNTAKIRPSAAILVSL